MSYGEEFKIDGINYLIEKFDEHVYIAKKTDNNNYSLIFEGNYTSFFWDEELKQLSDLQYEDSLYAILIGCLNWKGIINSIRDYKKFLHSLIIDGCTKEDILASSSDEFFVFLSMFPLKKDSFESITDSLLRQI